MLDDPTAFAQPLRLEAEWHRDRITTWKQMQEDYRRGDKSLYCMNVRLNILL